jgi:hypothetical protein
MRVFFFSQTGATSRVDFNRACLLDLRLVLADLVHVDGLLLGIGRPWEDAVYNLLARNAVRVGLAPCLHRTSLQATVQQHRVRVAKYSLNYLPCARRAKA